METKDVINTIGTRGVEPWPFDGETPLETVARLMREKNAAEVRAEKAEEHCRKWQVEAERLDKALGGAADTQGACERLLAETRACAEKAEEERDAEINRAHAHLEKRKAAERDRDEAISRADLFEKRLERVLALTEDDLADAIDERLSTGVAGANSYCDAAGKVVADLIRSRATEGAEAPTGGTI